MRLQMLSLGSFPLLLVFLDGDYSLRNTCFVQPALLKRPCLAASDSARAKHGSSACWFQNFGEFFLSAVVLFGQAVHDEQPASTHPICSHRLGPGQYRAQFVGVGGQPRVQDGVLLPLLRNGYSGACLPLLYWDACTGASFFEAEQRDQRAHTQ